MGPHLTLIALLLLTVAVSLHGCNSSGGGSTGNEFVVADFGLDRREPNATCLAPARPGQITSEGAPIALQEVFPGVTFPQPLALLQAPGNTGRWYVVTKDGRVFTMTPEGGTSIAIDIRDRVNASYAESGLLGMAFHPRFAGNRQVFLSYTRTGSPVVSYISRFTASADGATFDPASEQPILTVNQPFQNHNGGNIAFGPDGYLYIGLGDGGSGGDPLNNGQNTGSLLGKILRIDVDSASPYAIPADNPFASGTGGARPEIFAWGLRNPWRFSFDRLTGELWAGDVGQHSYEEIDRIVKGGNYGWAIREGAHCYDAPDCVTAGLIDPVAEYGHDQGLSVTGGYVYRGSAIPGLAGTYIYGDFGSGTIWGLGPGAGTAQTLLATNHVISSFAEGLDGELYVLNYRTGSIYRIVPGSGSIAAFPQTLSASGCVVPADPKQPAAGLIPYDINVPFWSDGADKARFLALPDQTTVHVAADGDWEFPIGSVLMKHFRLNGRLVETRLFMRHPDGDWGGYSYEWNDTQTDAALVAGGKTKVIDGQTWTFPSSTQCLECHTLAAGRSLGLETAQMNRSFDYASTVRRANQLATLAHIGLFDSPLPGAPSALPALPALNDATHPLAQRARAFLHANCAHCHRPGATTQSDMDLLYGTPEAGMHLCNAPPHQGDLGVANARLLAPGDPAHSLLALRMRAFDVTRMPPLASSVPDTAGIGMIESWIAAMTACP